MAKDKNAYLKFSPYSMKEYITRKLSEDPVFTDQIYEGSNLAVIIDLVSYMYQCLIFNLNKSASESMFADTQIFENITRLVSMLGYYPKGCSPSAFTARLGFADGRSESMSRTVRCLPYTRLATGLTDSRGKQIFFSTKFTSAGGQAFESDPVINVNFYNGQWKMYSKVFTASGIGNETFVLTGLKSDSAAGKYVAAGELFDVFVQPAGVDLSHYPTADGQTLPRWNSDPNGIFTRSSNYDQLNVDSTFYSGNGQDTRNLTQNNVYHVRLNSSHEYEISFGDGVIGNKLSHGDRVIVMYLDTNGPDGDVDLEEIDFSSVKVEHSAGALGMSQQLYKAVFGDPNPDENYGSVRFDGARSVAADTASLSPFSAEEGVEEIRRNAPDWYKTGNRLITAADYEYFVRNNRQLLQELPLNSVVDVRCMNNIEFAAVFYKWLYEQGRGFFGNGERYFSQDFWIRQDCEHVDPADANNTYLWIKSASDGEDLYDVGNVESVINSCVKPIKTLTTEVKVMKPVIVGFRICANPDFDDIRGRYMNASAAFDEDGENYVEVALDDNALYVSSTIQRDIAEIIKSAFSPDRCVLGQNVDFAGILAKIYAVSGVRRVRTVFDPKSGGPGKFYDGLSFAAWSPILDIGDDRGIDLTVGNVNRHLLPFQFPALFGQGDIEGRIRIIKKQLTAVNSITM